MSAADTTPLTQARTYRVAKVARCLDVLINKSRQICYVRGHRRRYSHDEAATSITTGSELERKAMLYVAMVGERTELSYW